MSAVLKIQLSHGHEKHDVLLETNEISLEEFSNKVEQLTGVPITSQRLIFKGRSLTLSNELLSSYGIVNNSKMMLIGRRFSEKDEGLLKTMKEVEGSLDTVEISVADLRKQYTDLKNGFLPVNLHSEAHSQMRKAVARQEEQLSRLLEKLDSLDLADSSVEVKNKRKSLVKKIQESLDKTDRLSENIEELIVSSS